jgi:hypothetical protein
MGQVVNWRFAPRYQPYAYLAALAQKAFVEQPLWLQRYPNLWEDGRCMHVEHMALHEVTAHPDYLARLQGG